MQGSSIYSLEAYQDYSLGLIPKNLSGVFYRINVRYPAKLDENIFITRLKIFEFKSKTVYRGNRSLLKRFVDYVNRLTNSQVRDILLKYTDRNVLSIIEKVGKIDLEKLVALLLWISDEEGFIIYGKPIVDVVVDEETDEFQFISIILPNCGADMWDIIVREVKDEMRRAGLDDMVSRVAIICLQGLQELLR